MVTDSFLSEFPPVATEQWEHIIRENIKGADYASKLIWHPEEGLAVRPYYRAEDLADLHFLGAAPGEFPYVRGARATADWRIREQIKIADPEVANRTACKAIAAGAEEIAFQSPKVESAQDLALLLAHLDEIPVHFEGLSRPSVEVLTERRRMRPHGASISTDLDPLADLAFSAGMIRNGQAGFRPFVIDADAYQERAAGAIEEVGFALSAAVDFTAEMRERSLDVESIAGSVAFSFAMGPDFFLQIAKLRAFRMVWANAVERFGGAQAAARATVHARTARWNETIYDPHVNILRATTEVISAILGGADSISCAPFDECYQQPNENSSRLARNTQIVLKQEALLSRVADPLGGAYLIEVLTNSIASKAWKLFQELETAGGYQKARAAGVIDSVLDRRAGAREKAVESRRRVLTGTNRFADASEKALDGINESLVDSAPRAARAFEAIRLRSERFLHETGQHRSILLAEIGDVKMRSARSQFAADFLACAGLAADTQRFESAAQIAGCDADLIVLCSSDAEYLDLAIELMQLLQKRGSRANVVVAGNPETAEELKKIGIVDFIHLRSNTIEVLAGLQQLLGIKD